MATLQNKMSDCHNIGDLIILLKQSISENLCVSSLAYFNSVVSNNGNYRVLSVKPFPLEYDQTEFNLQVYDFSVDYEYEKNDILLVVYADKNFTSQLGNKIPKNCLENELRHLVSYGIAVPLKKKDENKEIDYTNEVVIGKFYNRNLYRRTLIYKGKITSNTEFVAGYLLNNQTNSEIRDVVKIDYTFSEVNNNSAYSDYYSIGTNSENQPTANFQKLAFRINKSAGSVIGMSDKDWNEEYYTLLITIEYTKTGE